MKRNRRMYFAALAHVAGHEYHRGQRRAVTLFAVLVCLLVIMLFTGAVVQALTLRSRESRMDEKQLQCLFLVESAVSRARAQCLRDPRYAGEVWRVPLESHGEMAEGVAEIQVEAVTGEPQQRRLKIEARWPDEPIARVQRIRELVISLSESGVNL